MFRVLACTLTLALLGVVPVLADDCPTCEVKPDAARLKMLAALQLQACARAREAKPVSHGYDCLTDLAEAKRIAATTHKPLLVWVGGCDIPAREALDKSGLQAVHCHTADWCGNATPRLIIPAGDSRWCEVPRGQITPATVGLRLPSPLPSLEGANIVPQSTQYRVKCSGGSFSIVPFE